MTRKVIPFLAFIMLWSMIFSSDTLANTQQQPSREEIMLKRMDYYAKYHDMFVPWYYLAAIDQYERNIQAVRKDIPKREGIVALQFSKEYWVGALNPNPDDTSIASIQYFNGMGLDGDGDGKADLANDDDVMFTMKNHLSQYGPGEDNFKIALWEYYKNEKVVTQIISIAKLYKHFNTIDLDTHVFPVPVRGFNYSYRGTWGASRGWGGRRIHEGTDIFAGYGTPVVSTSYGVIEVMGWNEFGGWRIGIRDNHNTYHYYAHLAYFNKDLKVGDIVEPGTLIGGVGSTGYGKQGTSGKFPPHLHYGMYKFNGRTEWAFDPYPSLRQWEKETRQKKK